MVVAGDESLDGEYLVGGERAEYVGDPQCLGVAVEDDISPGNTAERDKRLLLISVPVNIRSKQETIGREFRDADSSKKSDRVGRIFVLDNGGYVNDMGDFFGVEEAENILSANGKLGRFRESDDNAVVVAGCREDSLDSAGRIVRRPSSQRAIEQDNPVFD